LTAGLIIGVINGIILLIIACAAAVLASLIVFYRIRLNEKKSRHEAELSKRQEIFEKIKETNFPVFMNNAKQKYGEIMFRYRLPQNPIIFKGVQYWCCDDFLLILPEWNYYQELIYKKYNKSAMSDLNSDDLFDDMCVINKRDIICFCIEKETTTNDNPYYKTKKKEADASILKTNKTVLEYRIKGILTKKDFPEEVFEIFEILIPDKRG
jgi:hypothetical protein